MGNSLWLVWPPVWHHSGCEKRLIRVERLHDGGLQQVKLSDYGDVFGLGEGCLLSTAEGGRRK